MIQSGGRSSFAHKLKNIFFFVRFPFESLFSNVLEDITNILGKKRLFANQMSTKPSDVETYLENVKMRAGWYLDHFEW